MNRTMFPHVLRCARWLGAALFAVAVMPVAQAHAQCELRLAPERLDYGQSTRGALLETRSGNGEVQLGKRSSTLHVHCPRPMPVALSFVAAAADADRYRFGGGSLGLRVTAVQVDGAPAQLARQGGDPAAAELALRPGDKAVPMLGGQPASGRDFHIEFETDARLPSDATRVAQPTDFETNGRFQVE